MVINLCITVIIKIKTTADFKGIIIDNKGTATKAKPNPATVAKKDAKQIIEAMIVIVK